MKTGKNTFKKIFVLSLCIFGLSGCGEDKNIVSVAFDNDYQSTWKVGDIDFSALKFFVTYSNGSTDTVPCNVSMVEETDVFKFYKVGDWKVKINFNEKYYNIVEFTIIENEFDESLKLKDETFTYDGLSHGLSIDGPLPEGTNVYFPQGNSFTVYSERPYEVKCVLSKDGYKTKELSGKLTIAKSQYSKELLDKIEFKDAEFVYDGMEKKIEAKNIPNDCKIDYFIGKNHGNSMINVGVYKITGVIKCSNPNYYDIPNIEATLTIKKAKHVLKDISFNDATFKYEPGEKRTLLLTNAKNIPNNVKVIYENNVQEEAGEYTATARFEVDSNHEEIEPMTAKLTILPKEIDLINFKFEKIQKATFNGEPKYFEVDAPDYLKITTKYFNSKNVEVSNPIDADTYQVVLNFEIADSLKKENYKLINIPDPYGFFVIQKKVLDLSVLNFESDSYGYDGFGHEFNVETEVEIDGQKVKYSIPEELVINKKYYTNGGEMSELPKDIGEYYVTFDPVFKSEINGKKINPDNYSIVNNEREYGILKIVKNKIDLSKVVLNDQSKYYNRGNVLNYDLGEIPEGVVATVKYYFNEKEVDKVVDVGTYFVSVTFALDENNGYRPDYYELYREPKNIPVLLVQKRPIDLTGVVPKDVTVPFTGTGIAYSSANILNFARVQEYVHPVYQYIDSDGNVLQNGELPTKKGTYDVIVVFELNPAYPKESYTIINSSKIGVKMIIQ